MAERNLNMTVLTGTARLLLVLTFNLNALLDCFAVCNLCFLEFNACTVSCLELGHDNVKVNVAET